MPKANEGGGVELELCSIYVFILMLISVALALGGVYRSFFRKKEKKKVPHVQDPDIMF